MKKKRLKPGDLIARVETFAFGPADAFVLDSQRVNVVTDSGELMAVSNAYFQKYLKPREIEQ